MKPFILVLVVTLVTLPIRNCHAQSECPVKWESITSEDFDISKYKTDSAPGALVIADIGSSSFKGNNKGWFTIIHKRRARIKIINRNGFDAATIQIPLYTEGNLKEIITDLKVSTYNLENSIITETKLNSKMVFEKRINPHLVINTVAIPAVKEGSVIDYSYTLNSDFIFNMQPWKFQGKYPALWSEYEVRIPVFFRYLFLSQGSGKFYINEKYEDFQSFQVISNENAVSRNILNFKVGLLVNRWVMKEVPALKEESFISSPKNYISKIEFQLSEFLEPLPPKKFTKTWLAVNDEFMKSDQFGIPISTVNSWLGETTRQITSGAVSQLDIAKKIYYFIKNNFTCTSYQATQLATSLKIIFKNRTGTVADMNLLLTAMLRYANFSAYPVLLSTRENGLAYEELPIMNRFNYLIVQARVDNKEYYLDASHTNLGFGKLPIYCYNGMARVFGEQRCEPLYFTTDSLTEKKTTSVIIADGGEGEISGRVTSLRGYYESLEIREAISNKGENVYFNQVNLNNNGIEMNDHGIDSLHKLEDPIQLHFNFVMKLKDDIIYFNPMMTEAHVENYFKDDIRRYPVELTSLSDETYIFNMKIPPGYKVDEFPASSKFLLNKNDGYFEYTIQKDSDSIHLFSRILISKTNFPAEGYSFLKEFYEYIVKKHKEQIVFKKIKK